MQYCQRCVLPNTRPNLTFNAAGICSACTNQIQKPTIDWVDRAAQFKQLVADVKAKNARWDCVIPVSGGKDSTWQVIQCLAHGLKPLCVTWRTPARNPLGQKNLDNLIALGADHIDVSINPSIERYFTLKALKEKGSVAIPMHMALFSIPLQTAMQWQVPLVVWGENSACEYGDTNFNQGFEMSQDWLKRYGVTQGTVASDWYDEVLQPNTMPFYQWPSDQALKQSDVRAIFLGDYFSWDPTETFAVAERHGFEAAPTPKTGYYAYADIDDAFLITIHHWLKWYKFGFTRLWDNLSLEIRGGRLSRQQAIEIIRQQGDETPHEAIAQFCQWAKISVAHFYDLIAPFRQSSIWRMCDDTWMIPDFLIKDWVWSQPCPVS